MNSYIPIPKTSHTVHIQIDKGNITNEKTQAVVIFRDQNDGTATGDSERVLYAAGKDGIDAEYREVKSHGGRTVSKGVVMTSAGHLRYPRYLFHIHVKQDTPWRLTDTVITSLCLADSMGLNSIAFPRLPDGLQTEPMIERLLESFVEFIEQKRPICLHFIQVVMTIDDKPTLSQYLDERFAAQDDINRYKVHARNVRSVVVGESRMLSSGGREAKFWAGNSDNDLDRPLQLRIRSSSAQRPSAAFSRPSTNSRTLGAELANVCQTLNYLLLKLLKAILLMICSVTVLFIVIIMFS